MYCSMVPDGGAYQVTTPYSRVFVADLKSTVPSSERAYDRDKNVWYVSAQYGGTAAALIERWFGRKVTPAPITASAMLGIITVLYLGKTKDRGNGEMTAFGWTENRDGINPLLAQLNIVPGGWNVIFPEKVLRAYFDPSYTEQSKPRPTTKNYYETLSIKEGASAEEIKSGYRRMVRQWHPDVCKEPDANEVFLTIQKAYSILSDPRTKARYDVGLKMAARVKEPEKPQKTVSTEPYRAPLKCGNLLCEFIRLGPVKSVRKILRWEDVYDIHGKVLVSSWQANASEPTLEWR